MDKLSPLDTAFLDAEDAEFATAIVAQSPDSLVSLWNTEIVPIVVDTPGNEALHVLAVLPVELIQCVGIAGDPGEIAPVPTTARLCGATPRLAVHTATAVQQSLGEIWAPSWRQRRHTRRRPSTAWGDEAC